MLTYTNESILKILGIDPGLNNLGLAHVLYDMRAKRVMAIHTYVISPARLRDISGLDEEDYGEFYKKLASLRKYFRGHLKEFCPEQIVSESPFFDRRKPSSYEYLVSVMMMLRDEVIAYNPNVGFVTASPQEIKKWLGVAGQIGKEPVKEAFKQRPVLMSALSKPIANMTDHEIDAASAACSWAYKRFELEEM